MNPEPIQWGATRAQPLGAPAAPVTGQLPTGQDFPPVPPRRRRTGLVVVLVLAALVVIGGTAAGTYLLTRPSGPAPAAAASVPVLSNIPQPNPACTPAADRKLGPGDNLSSILFVGYVDGRQQERVVNEVMVLALSGHKIEYVWYCPLRSQWH